MSMNSYLPWKCAGPACWWCAIAVVSIVLACSYLSCLLPTHSQVDYQIRGKAASKNDYQAVLLVNEALPLINSGSLIEAIDKLEQALKLSPDLTEAHYNLGVALSRLGKSEAAQKHFKVVVDSGADLPSAWISLAVNYQNSGKLEEAIEIYKNALERFPKKTWKDLPEIHYNYGLALGKAGQPAAAIEQLKIATLANQQISGLWLSLGALYQESGRVKESIEAYKEFLQKFPDNEEAPRIRAAVGLMERELREGRKVNRRTEESVVAEDYFADITSSGIKRWSSRRMPLRVYIKSGRKLHGYKSDYDEVLKQCFQEWLDSSDGVISAIYVLDPSQANIQCSWSDDMSSLSNCAEGGEARLYVTNTGSIARAKIVILTVPLTPLRPVTDNLIRFVCLHEIGHALGLSGHSTQPGDIMFFSSSVTDERRELSARDIRTIKKLYSSKMNERLD